MLNLWRIFKGGFFQQIAMFSSVMPKYSAVPDTQNTRSWGWRTAKMRKYVCIYCISPHTHINACWNHFKCIYSIHSNKGTIFFQNHSDLAKFQCSPWEHWNPRLFFTAAVNSFAYSKNMAAQLGEFCRHVTKLSPSNVNLGIYAINTCRLAKAI